MKIWTVKTTVGGHFGHGHNEWSWPKAGPANEAFEKLVADHPDQTHSIVRTEFRTDNTPKLVCSLLNSRWFFGVKKVMREHKGGGRRDPNI